MPEEEYEFIVNVIEGVVLHKGVVEPTKHNRKMELTIPQGMSGEQLVTWKRKNEKEINKLISKLNESKNNKCE